MNWFSLLRRLRALKQQPLSGRRRSRPAARHLWLERLEERDVPAAPTVVSVSPPTGGVLGTQITVVFSEDVTGANVASNYRLFASDGTQVNISSVSYNAGNFTATILASNLSGGAAPLTAGTY